MPREWTFIEQLDDYHVLRSGSTLKIVLARPRKGNALTCDMLEGICRLIKATELDTTIFRIAFTAQGRYFCTGMDLNAANIHHNAESDLDAHERQWQGIVGLCEAIQSSSKVTSTAINGPAFGAGIALAFACDVRLAVEKASFTVSEGKLGIPPTVILNQLINEWGTPRAREATLSARPVSAYELYSAGIISHLASDVKGLEALFDHHLDQLSSCGPEASRLSKSIFLALPAERDQLLKQTYDFAMTSSKEAQHGIRCFHEKSKPDWEAFYQVAKSRL